MRNMNGPIEVLENLHSANNFDQWLANWDSLIANQLPEIPKQKPLLSIVTVTKKMELPSLPTPTGVDLLLADLENCLMESTSDFVFLSSVLSDTTIMPSPTSSTCSMDDFFNSMALDSPMPANSPSPLSKSWCPNTTTDIESPKPSIYKNEGKPPIKVSSKIPDKAFKKVVEDGKQMYHCTWANCKRKFTRRSANCRAHWLRHNNLNPFVCMTCSLAFEKTTELNRHNLSCHSGKKE
jgi:hypothetical protein